MDVSFIHGFPTIHAYRELFLGDSTALADDHKNEKKKPEGMRGRFNLDFVWSLPFSFNFFFFFFFVGDYSEE